ncbi:MAG: SMC family ATPase, partial [Candidatus Aenigmarchaeota archaeon]|nr:SMC family ATPase [Candidatus Aenigmarchaeota archaeon]
MIIEFIHLQNIRSYANEKIKFPSGSVLLEGDIGCGKSSILLAIDFALFGLRVGELSGAELLRHGKPQGSVVLKIRLGGCDVEISRTLERKKDTIAQSAGYAIVDGVRHDLTGFALRFFVFELLGYPINLLRKNKSLLYRYTVYTPQEEMKAILLISSDERTSIMRHVFGIDRYRRLRGNTSIVSRNLRRKIEWLSGLSEGLEEKEKQRAEMLVQGKEILDEIDGLHAKVKTAEEEIAERKKDIDALEKQTQEFVSTTAKITVAVSKKDMLEKQALVLQKESSVLAERQKEMSGDLKDFGEKAEKLKNEILKKNDLKTQAEHFEKEVRAIDSVMSENSARQKVSGEILERVKSINQCPTCLQDVGEAHKRAILGGEEIKISNFQKIFSKLEDEKKIILENLGETKKSLEKITEYERELTGLLASEKEIKRIAEDLAVKEKALLDSGTEKEALEKEIVALKSDAEKNAESSELHVKAKKESEVLEAELSLKKQALARTLQQQEDLKKSLESIELEIADKRHAEKQLSGIKKLYSWLENQFS